MTLRLEINGVDFTSKWRPYESHWSMRAFNGESAAETEFIIDDDLSDINHLNLASLKVIEVWEDASGTDVCLFRGRVTNKTLGRGPLRTGLALRWTVTAADANYDLRGIRIDESTRPEEDDIARVTAYRSNYLNGSSSPNANARDSTQMDADFIISGFDVTLGAETYTDTDPETVIRSITDFSGKQFFVYLEDDGQLQLYYASHTDTTLLSDIELTDAGTDDGVDVYAPYLTPPTGSHDGLRILTGGSIRYGDDEFYESSDFAGGEAFHDKWEEHFTDQFVQSDSDAQTFLHAQVTARSNEDFTYTAVIDMTAANVHRIRAGMQVLTRMASANLVTPANQRAVQVSLEPVYPDEDGEARYRVTIDLGVPRVHPYRRNTRMPPPLPPKQPVEGTVTRWYPRNGSGSTNITEDAAWDNSTFASGGDALTRTPSNTVNGQQTWSAVNAAAGDYGNWQGSIVINSGEAAALAAGGTFRMQTRTNSRYGVGISEAAQDNYLTLGLRIWRSGPGIVGTSIAVGSAIGGTKFIAQATNVNRSVAGTFSPVAAVAGDIAYLEVGTHHVGPTSGGTGSRVILTDTSATDLPEDNTTTAADNMWFEFATGSSGGSTTQPTTGGDVGSPGTSNVYAPIDHVHPHGMLDPDAIHMHADQQVHQQHTNDTGDPTTGDDADAGYSRGWTWNNTTSGDVFFLRDATAGAADWLLIAPETGGSGSSSFVSIAKWGTD